MARPYAGYVHPFAGELVADPAAKLIVGDATKKGDRYAKARERHGRRRGHAPSRQASVTRRNQLVRAGHVLNQRDRIQRWDADADDPRLDHRGPGVAAQMWTAVISAGRPPDGPSRAGSWP